MIKFIYRPNLILTVLFILSLCISDISMSHPPQLETYKEAVEYVKGVTDGLGVFSVTYPNNTDKVVSVNVTFNFYVEGRGKVVTTTRDPEVFQPWDTHTFEVIRPFLGDDWSNYHEMGPSLEGNVTVRLLVAGDKIVIPPFKAEYVEGTQIIHIPDIPKEMIKFQPKKRLY